MHEYGTLTDKKPEITAKNGLNHERTDQPGTAKPGDERFGKSI